METRKPSHAGAFYPKEKSELDKMLAAMLRKSKPKKLAGKLRALIVPHAGFIYSGEIAAFAFNALKEAKPGRVVLFGPSHYAHLVGAYGFVMPWETPLGTVEVQKAALETFDGDKEHSLEVELPFLQTILKKFEFVPVIYGEIKPQELLEAVGGLVVKNTVLVASSDLSHYLPYQNAKIVDLTTISAILQLDFEEFMHSGDACGKTGIAALIILAKKLNWNPVLLDYRNSGDTAGDRENVVGYAAIAFMEDEKPGAVLRSKKSLLG